MSTVLQPRSTAAIQVLQISDFHLLNDPGDTMMGINTEESFKAVLQAAGQHHAPADLVLLTGDLAQDATPACYRRLKGHLEELRAPVFCMPGNHDDPELMATDLAGGLIALEKQILIGSWQILCLDSTVLDSAGGYLRAEQMDWLASLLAENRDRFTVISLHHSPLPTGSLWLDTMRLGNADPFLELLERSGQVRCVVFGHVHQEMDARRGGLRLLACPSSCFQFKQGSGDFALDPVPPGYRWLRLNQDGSVETGVERLSAAPAGLDLSSDGY